ncbi:ribonuclease H-like domain-containing protein [Tanacetum coccineum]
MGLVEDLILMRFFENSGIRLNAIWKQFDALIELPRCTCHAADDFKKHSQLMKLMQFFMGLDDTYMQIRSSILSREVLSDVRSAYATIFSEESYRVASSSIAGSSQRNHASAFVSNMPNRNNFQRNQTSNNGPRPNNREAWRGGMTKPHSLAAMACFKLIGYPADFGKKKSGQNLKNRNVSNNNIVGSNSSSGFTDEQLFTLISLIKDTSLNGKNVQANMTGANQHMTHTDKELDNVYDISHLRIKVIHPNETEAFISKIGNLRLSNGLVLYDVLVILEYCVTIISVHKWAKDDKIFVAFDESKCYFLNQDLNLRNVMGIGNQCEWLYYFNNQDPVFFKSLQFDIKDQIVFCEICQMAKQSKEPFPLSDHISTFLGDLVHLDLWGPYKVTSFEGLHSYVLNGKSPYEMIYKKPPTLYHLRVFGCFCFATIVNNNDKVCSRSQKCVMMGYSNFKKGYLLYSLDRHQFIFLKDVKFFESIFPFKDYVNEKAGTALIFFQNLNHINFFDVEYPKIPNDDKRVNHSLNRDQRSQSDSSYSFVFGGDVKTADFPNDNSGNDAQSSDDIFAAQDK